MAFTAYRDFATGRTKRTRGVFACWTKPSGPLQVRYAIFRRLKSRLFVPEYELTKETISRLNTDTL